MQPGSQPPLRYLCRCRPHNIQRQYLSLSLMFDVDIPLVFHPSITPAYLTRQPSIILHLNLLLFSYVYHLAPKRPSLCRPPTLSIARVLEPCPRLLSVLSGGRTPRPRHVALGNGISCYQVPLVTLCHCPNPCCRRSRPQTTMLCCLQAVMRISTHRHRHRHHLLRRHPSSQSARGCLTSWRDWNWGPRTWLRPSHAWRRIQGTTRTTYYSGSSLVRLSRQPPVLPWCYDVVAPGAACCSGQRITRCHTSLQFSTAASSAADSSSSTRKGPSASTRAVLFWVTAVDLGQQRNYK